MGSEDTRRAYRQLAEEALDGNPHVRLRLIKDEASRMVSMLVESVARTSMTKHYSIQEARQVRSGWYNAKWARLARWLSDRRVGRWLLPVSISAAAWAYVWQVESRRLPLPKETEDRIRIQLAELYRREVKPERILVGREVLHTMWAWAGEGHPLASSRLAMWTEFGWDSQEVTTIAGQYPQIAGLPVELCPWLDDDAVVVIGKAAVVRSV